MTVIITTYEFHINHVLVQDCEDFLQVEQAQYGDVRVEQKQTNERHKRCYIVTSEVSLGSHRSLKTWVVLFDYT